MPFGPDRRRLWVGYCGEWQVSGARSGATGRHKVRRGNRLPLGDQEAVGGDAQRGVMVEAAPPSPLVMSQPDLLLEFLVVALDAPAPPGLDPGVGEIDEPLDADLLGQRGQPVLGRLGLALRPLDEQPFLRADSLAQVVAMRGADAAAGETAAEGLIGALAPRDGLPGLLRQLQGECLDRHRLVRVIAAQPLGLAGRGRSMARAATAACPAPKPWCSARGRRHRSNLPG